MCVYIYIYAGIYILFALRDAATAAGAWRQPDPGPGGLVRSAAPVGEPDRVLYRPDRATRFEGGGSCRRTPTRAWRGMGWSSLRKVIHLSKHCVGLQQFHTRKLGVISVITSRGWSPSLLGPSPLGSMDMYTRIPEEPRRTSPGARAHLCTVAAAVVLCPASRGASLADALGIRNPSGRQGLYIQQLCSRWKVNARKL